jgi:DNA-binding GntR family transcriptional regulator
MRQAWDIAPINSRPVREQVYEALKGAITSGRFSIGETLPERELAASLGVSRTPLREALIILQQEGLVAIRPYRGVEVVGVSRRQYLDQMELRELLEAHAARRTAEQMSQEDRLALQALFDRLAPRIESRDMDAFVELNAGFHAAVARGSRNAELERLIDTYEERETRYLHTIARDPGMSDMLQSYKEHCGILQALLERDAEEASRLMAAHVHAAAARAAHLFPESQQP